MKFPWLIELMMSSPASINRPLTLFRIVQIGLLVSMFWKYEFFGRAIKTYFDIQIVDPFFPALFRDPRVLSAMFVAVAVAAIAGMFFRGVFRRVCSAVTVLGCGGLCLHQASYNDATFTTMWWVSLWSFWLSMHVDALEPGQSRIILRKAAFLSRVIVSMILLGGATGKWTAEYWSGQVLHEIYFVDRNFWVFNQLRSYYDAETLRTVATHYSRMIIVTETIFGLGLWLLPPKIAATLGILLLISIVVFSNFLLMSVMGCLIAMLTAGMFVARNNSLDTESNIAAVSPQP